MKKRKHGQQNKEGQGKQFVNRVEELALLKNYLDLAPGQTLPVLSFYGIGGVGKSALLKKFKSTAEERSLRHAFLDFDTTKGGHLYIMDYSYALGEIRRQLDVECPRFDLAYAMLRHKQGLGDEPLLKGAGKANTAWELTKEGASALINDIPGSNIIIWLTEKLGSKYVDKAKETKVGKWIASKTGNDDFLQLIRLLPQDIYEQLISRLALDLEEQISDQDCSSCQAIIIIDSFEYCASSANSRVYQQRLEEWLRRLYEELTNTLLIIAGRDRLLWKEVDEDWGDEQYLQQINLNGLSQKDARQFLLNSGVKDEVNQAHMLSASSMTAEHEKYHPMSLGLCIDTLKNQQLSASDDEITVFTALEKKDKFALARRFIQSIPDDNLRNWLFYLALTPKFTASTAKHIYSAIETIERETAWQQLLTYSFIEQQASGFLTMHKLMRDTLLELWDVKKEKIELHKTWKSLWNDASEDYGDTASRLAFHHGYRIEPVDEFLNWQSEVINARRAEQMELHLNLSDWLSETSLEQQNTFTLSELKMLSGANDELLTKTLGDRHLAYRRCKANAEKVLAHCSDQFLLEAEAKGQLATILFIQKEGNKIENERQALKLSKESIQFFLDHQDQLLIEPLLWMHLASLYTSICFSDYFEKDYYEEALIVAEQAINYFERFNLKKYQAEDLANQYFLKIFDPEISWSNLKIAQALGLRKKGKAELNLDCLNQSIQVFLDLKKQMPASISIRQKSRILYSLAATYADIVKLDSDPAKRKSAAFGVTYHAEEALNFLQPDTYPLSWGYATLNAGYGYILLEEFKEDHYTKAKFYCNQLLDTLSPAEFPQLFGMALNNLIAISDGEELKDLISKLKSLPVFQNKDQDPKLWAQSMLNVGNRLIELDEGASEEARAYFKNALTVYTPDIHPMDYTACLFNLALSYHTKKADSVELEAAIPHLQNIIEVLNKLDESAKIARANYWLGETYRKIGILQQGADNYKNAVLYYDQSLSIYKRLNNIKKWKDAFYGKVQCLLKLSNDDLSFAQALQEFIGPYLDAESKMKDPELWAVAHSGIGELKVMMFEKIHNNDLLHGAIQDFEQSFEVINEQDYLNLYANNYRMLLSAYAKLPIRSIDDHVVKTINACKEALKYYKSKDHLEEHCELNINLAYFYIRATDGDQFSKYAKEFLEDAKLFLEGIVKYVDQLNPDTAYQLLQNLSVTYQRLAVFDQEYYKKAIECNEKGLALANASGMLDKTLNLTINLSAAYIRMANTLKDLSYAEKGLNILNELYEKLDANTPAPIRGLILRNIGGCYYTMSQKTDKGLIVKAIKYLSRAVNEYAPEQYPSELAQIHHTLFACYYHLGDEENAIDRLQKSIHFYKAAGFHEQADKLEQSIKS